MIQYRNETIQDGGYNMALLDVILIMLRSRLTSDYRGHKIFIIVKDRKPLTKVN